MTVRAQVNGVQGVVLSGRCRDLQEQWDSGFPVSGERERHGSASTLWCPCSINKRGC
jgi:regulator of RNase E activity RraA